MTQALAAPPSARIVAEVEAACDGVPGVDAGRLLAAARAADGGDAGALRELAIGEAAALVPAEPGYSRVAARLLGGRIRDDAASAGVRTFAESVAAAHREGLLADAPAAFVAAHASDLDALVDEAADDRFEYFGLRTLYDRYLLRHPRSRLVLERPQHFFLRVACGLSESVEEVAELYGLLSTLSYLPSSPTLFNSAARRPQLSSCFLLDSPRDELESIYERYGQIARLSKYAGGIGVSWTKVRSRGSLIRGTNGYANGIVPWLRTLDASVAAVNQGGRRKGAACVYLEPWHADVEEFLELRDNTGEDARRTHNLNLANWIPDEFMRRVEADATWSLFDPKEVPELADLWGEAFDEAYRAAEKEGRFVRQIPARKLYGRMMRTLAETGNGWMTFKDAANRACNQTAEPGQTVHLSNLCTEILEVTADGEAAVCNLGSVNLAAHVDASGIDWERLRSTVRTAVRFLDRTIDRGFYPTPEAEKANRKWRPVGLGVMGLADVFFTLRLPFDSAEARELSTRIAEEIALAAYHASADLAALQGPLPAYGMTRTARGQLHPDHFPDAAPSRPDAWEALRARVADVGLRNSLLIAIAPTATIASIAGCYECIEPQVSNLFKRETLSGEFLQINRYLVDDLKSLGLWTPAVREAIKKANGSVQGLLDLPDEMRALYRTAWELPQKALIDMAAGRTPYIDQAHSLNLFMETPTIGKLSSMYAYAWRSGLKTTYYLRSRPATRIAQTTVAAAVCSLENPETCEACQ
ncbi:ribonucleoside-diphosphate reductase subunit alpha [Actinomadura madurae]|uniref:ribonucleoside-diphosphate reductase subunit alpha n=1 Tax=Actinomadura madurae TaxID=1993 RepID=UPI0020D20EB6|nr:ribonucleoside-diphosphate reductase subunit alpha [Actinomadura madurae]MCP9969254.1 ribonucleoside-diphosphate reductase subunit alpha [Actinomadura madurae]MCP9981731.1 ribonucleoside-diphosphate reductase subunit alpha [Actinomadura madurae]MCQ0006754.1 ribonucleoside-diphosphate reductase subunit alpha [Actinomadura madurae]